MEAKRPILITNDPLSTARYNIPVVSEKHIKTVFFVKQGMSKATVTFEKDSYVAG
jgi:hypothetical protein